MFLRHPTVIQCTPFSRSLSQLRSFPATLTEGKYTVKPFSFDVPRHIPRPPYALDSANRDMSKCKGGPYAEVKSEEVIEKVRKAARIAANALLVARDEAKPGVTTHEVDHRVAEYIVSEGAFPSGLNFFGFPKTLCASVNECVVHGLPDSRPLEGGDIVNFDVTCFFGGVYGDCSMTVEVGEVDKRGKDLIQATEDALYRSIASCRHGQKFSAIGQACESEGKRTGFSVSPEFCGHFIGEFLHMDPNIHHVSGVLEMEREMEAGQVFTIEPILCEGSTKSRVWKDGWTFVTQDHGRTAQWEHMVLIKEGGAEVLTLPDEEETRRKILEGVQGWRGRGKEGGE